MIGVFEIFGRTFSIYQVLALLGIFACGLYACWAARRAGQDDNDMIVLLLWAAVGVLLGGHLLYGLVNIPLLAKLLPHLPGMPLGEVLQNLMVVFGGAVFYGGLLGGLVAGFICLRAKRMDIPLYTDLAAPAIPLFHLFGRLGCFLSGCCYGIKSPLGFVYHYSPLPGANGLRRFPVQLLEAGVNLGLFVLLALLLRRGRLPGKLLRLYLCLYAFSRFFLEFLRGDALRGFLWGLSTSQAISLGVLAVTLASFLPALWRRYRPAR